MSHRVTTDTEIKDKTLAIQVLNQAGIQFQDQGNSLTILSGPMRNATLNLTTGRVSGDTDHGHNEKVLGALRQSYGEAKYRSECHRQGIQIESRTVDREGNVILMCAML